MADPEPISDISAQNTNVGSPNQADNGTNQHPIPISLSKQSIPVVHKTYPKHLQPLLGKLGTEQVQLHKEKKIVLYVLAAQSGECLFLNSVQ